MENKYQFEEWRDIPEYFGLYQVSNLGRVKSLNYMHTGKERILKLEKTKDGYLRVGLWKDGKAKWFRVHLLVAEAFLPNSDNLPQVNHKNEIKTDNRVCNLEFCDAKYNINYGTGIKRRAEKRIGVFNTKKSKPVNQYTKEGLLMASYPSAMEAQRQTGYNRGYISSCCNGRYKSSYGYIWRFA